MMKTLDDFNGSPQDSVLEEAAEDSFEEITAPLIPADEPVYTVDDSEYCDLSMYFNKDDVGRIDLFEEEEWSFPEEEAAFADEPVICPEICDTAEEAPAAEEETEISEETGIPEETEPAAEEETETVPEEDAVPVSEYETASDEAEEAAPAADIQAPEETVTDEETPGMTSEDTPEENVCSEETAESAVAEELSHDNEDAEETDSSGKKTKSPKKKKKWPVVILVLLLAGLLAFAGIRFFGNKAPEANVLIREGESCSAGSIELTVDRVCVIGSLLNFELDDDYVYIAVQYTFRNTSGQELTWENTPYMMLRPFIKTEEGYVPVEPGTEEAEKLLSVCGASEPGQKTDDEADELKCLYGTFDFSALQIYSLDCGIDYSNVKEPLKGGESRVSADVFRLRKELFDTGMYYICADNQNAVIFIDPVPVDVDEEIPPELPPEEAGSGN